MTQKPKKIGAHRVGEKQITRSEAFREFTFYINADYEEDRHDEGMFHEAGQHMTKQGRREMVELPRDFEAGRVSFEDIQNLWNGSCARFYIIGEPGVRSFLYRARHVLEQSFFLTDIEDLKAGKASNRRKRPERLSPDDERTVLRLADIFCEFHELDPQWKQDHRRDILERLTAGDRDDVAKLVARIARATVTEELLRASWNAHAAVRGIPMPGTIASFAFGIAHLIDGQA